MSASSSSAAHMNANANATSSSSSSSNASSALAGSFGTLTLDRAAPSARFSLQSLFAAVKEQDRSKGDLLAQSACLPLRLALTWALCRFSFAFSLSLSLAIFSACGFKKTFSVSRVFGCIGDVYFCRISTLYVRRIVWRILFLAFSSISLDLMLSLLLVRVLSTAFFLIFVLILLNIDSCVL